MGRRRSWCLCLAVIALLLVLTWSVSAQTERLKQLLITDGQGSILKLPSMTTTERDASSHVNGESIYCSNCSPAGVYFFFGGSWHESGSGGTGGAPTDATYITQTPSGALSAEQAMSLLGTGLVKNTTATGIQSIYAGASCPAGEGVSALSASGAATCIAVGGVTPGAALAGVVTISGTATTAAVVFGVAQDDTTYVLTGWTRPLTGTPPHVTSDYLNKTTAGFDVEISAAPGAGNSVEVNWQLSQAGTNPLVGPAGPTGAQGPGTNIKTCVVTLGDPGAASPLLADDNDSPVACPNDWQTDWTITTVACWANAGAPTVTPILTGGSATSVLTGALTCGTAAWAAGTVQGTAPVVHPFSGTGATCASTPCSIDVNITTAGGTAKYLVVKITGTI